MSDQFHRKRVDFFPVTFGNGVRDAANRAGVLLTPFHNRRWDSDQLTLRRHYAAFWKAISMHAVEQSLQSRKGVALTVTAAALLLAMLWVFDLMRPHMLPLPPTAPIRGISVITAPAPPPPSRGR